MIFDCIVIGKGLIGSAAARYLIHSQKNVMVIGPDEHFDMETVHRLARRSRTFCSLRRERIFCNVFRCIGQHCLPRDNGRDISKRIFCSKI